MDFPLDLEPEPTVLAARPPDAKCDHMTTPLARACE